NKPFANSIGFGSFLRYLTYNITDGTENSENTNYLSLKVFDFFFSSLFINIALRTINLGLESLFIKKEKIYEFNFLMNEFYKRYIIIKNH
ncbi:MULTISPECIES: hypothetical protein, partial [Bacillus cereus group]